MNRIISKEEEREDPRRDSSIYNYKAHPVQAPSSNCSPCLQALHTAGSSYKAPYSIPGPYSTSRLPVILGGRNSILHGSQHPRSPYSSSQAHSCKNSTRRNRILSKRVKYCISNTILRSVCSNLLITRILILSRVLIIPCEDTVHYLQSKLS